MSCDALVFDSGIGGLGVVEELREAAPCARLAYLADNACFPYGALDDATLTARLLAVMAAGIETTRPRIVVLACNTASTIGLDALRARFDIPFVGCVPPIKWAASLSRTRRIGLLATPATVRRPYLRWLTETFAADCTILAHGAPSLAALAESRFLGDPVDPARIAEELGPLRYAEAVDVIALGCTHYRFLLPELRAALDPGLLWLDPAGPVARRAAHLLDGRGSGGLGAAYFTAPPGPGEMAWALADGFSDVTTLTIQRREAILF